MRLTPRIDGVTAGLAVGISAAVVVACAAAAYVYSLHHFQALLDTARTTALAEGEMIRVALEHQMMENDRSLIQRMIGSFATQRGIERLVLLDRLGQPRYSSAPLRADDEFEIGSPTCQSCHQFPPDRRGSSRVIETRGGTVLRTVVPFRNEERCHRCHDPGHRMNGILILDTNAGMMRARMNQDLQWMVAGSCVLALFLVGTIGLVIRVVLLRRLQRFETAARLIAAGDIDRRVPTDGGDTISWLAREFNSMADSVTGLVGEVRNERERLETIINSIDDGIAVLDPERNVIAANDAFLRRAGRVREQLVGCSCQTVSAGMCTGTDCPTLSCMESGERQVRICQRSDPDGKTAWEEVQSSPVRDGAGRVRHVVEVWRDISDRRAAEARLAESHRLASLGMLASGFSHELNTPLATVLTCVEGILRDARASGDGGSDPQRTRDNATIAREQILRCRGITQHFLRMSRGQRSSPNIVDLQAAVTAAARLVEPTARERRVEIRVEPMLRGSRVRLDDAELQDTLINLLLNAIQACQAGGVVGISIEPGDPIHVRVTDNGSGIAPQDQRRIFEPFFSLTQGGTGLGLFLSLNSVRRWGGDIRVTSTVGVGSTFDVVLPAFGGASALEPAS